MRLRQASEPAWITLVDGAAVLARPATTALVFIARAKASQLLDELSDEADVISFAGATIEGLPPLETDADRAGFRTTLFTLCLAEAAIIDWRGVLDADGTELAFDAKLVPHLMQHGAAATAFLASYLRTEGQVDAEKKA